MFLEKLNAFVQKKNYKSGKLFINYYIDRAFNIFLLNQKRI
jgi:hypothetical protein